MDEETDGAAGSTPVPASSLFVTDAIFGVGASGLTSLGSAGSGASAEITELADVAADRGVSAGKARALQQKRATVASIRSPQWSQSGGRIPSCNLLEFTVPRYRCHWSFGHVWCSTYPLDQVGLRVRKHVLFQPERSASFRKNCYNPRESFGFHPRGNVRF